MVSVSFLVKRYILHFAHTEIKVLFLFMKCWLTKSSIITFRHAFFKTLVLRYTDHFGPSLEFQRLFLTNSMCNLISILNSDRHRSSLYEKYFLLVSGHDLWMYMLILCKFLNVIAICFNIWFLYVYEIILKLTGLNDIKKKKQKIFILQFKPVLHEK